jgi:hypothetical protein
MNNRFLNKIKNMPDIDIKKLPGLKTYIAHFLDTERLIVEYYKIKALDEAKARKEAERIAKMENKTLILFKAVST